MVYKAAKVKAIQRTFPLFPPHFKICLIKKVENDSAVQGNVSESLIVPQNQEQPLSHRWDNAK